MLRIGFIAVLGAVYSTAAFSAEQNCKDALVVSSTKISESVITQLSFAYNLSESAWSEKKKDASANGYIYDVPVGASYSDYQKNVVKRAQDFHLDRFAQRAYSYATSGLNDESLQAYKSCLEATKNGFYLLAGAGSEDTYEAHLINSPGPGLDHSITGSLKVPTNISDDSLSFLRETVEGLKYADSWDLHIPLRPIDPNKEMSFVVKFGGDIKDLLLPPLKTAPPRKDVAAKAEYILKHRVMGVNPQDCAEIDEKGGVGGFPVNHVMRRTICLSVNSENLPSSFKIDTSSVTAVVPKQACAWLACYETSNDTAASGDPNIFRADQCKPVGSQKEYCFQVVLKCGGLGYDESCKEPVALSGEAVDTSK